MSFDWSEYLVLAQELTTRATQATSSSKQEAMLRCAVSRAYFAAFGGVQNRLRNEGETIPPAARGHQIAVNLLRASPDVTRQTMGQILEYLRSKRNIVDYDNVVSDLLPLTEGVLALTEQVISWLDSLP